MPVSAADKVLKTDTLPTRSRCKLRLTWTSMDAAICGMLQASPRAWTT